MNSVMKDLVWLRSSVGKREKREVESSSNYS